MVHLPHELWDTSWKVTTDDTSYQRTMVTGNKIVCVACDELVTVGVTYDGYYGECGCSKYYFTVGSKERPRSWEKWNDVSSPSYFTVYREGEFCNGNIVEEDCIVCNRCDDGANVSISTEAVDLLGTDLKVEFCCSEEHGRYDSVNESIAYYDSEYGDGAMLSR